MKSLSIFFSLKVLNLEGKEQKTAKKWQKLTIISLTDFRIFTIKTSLIVILFNTVLCTFRL